MSSHPDRCVRAKTSFSPLHWRARREYSCVKRLGSELSALAAVHGATCLVPDETLRSSFDRVHLGTDAVALVRFRFAGVTSTIAVPTFRTWSRNERRRLAISIAEGAFAVGRYVQVVSPYDVTLQPRLANAMRMFQVMRPPIDGDARAVRRRIVADGGTTSLQACEEALACPSSRERIFGLMAGGTIAIDLAGLLGSHSTVRLNPDGWTFDWDVLGWQAVIDR